MNRCETYKRWDFTEPFHGDGICIVGRIETPPNKSMYAIPEAGSNNAEIYTGPEFGCVLHENK